MASSVIESGKKSGKTKSTTARAITLLVDTFYEDEFAEWVA